MLHFAASMDGTHACVAIILAILQINYAAATGPACVLFDGNITVQYCEFSPWTPWLCKDCCHGIGPPAVRKRFVCCPENTDIPECHAACHLSITLRYESHPCATKCPNTCPMLTTSGKPTAAAIATTHATTALTSEPPTKVTTTETFTPKEAMEAPKIVTQPHMPCASFENPFAIELCNFTPWSSWLCGECCHGNGPPARRSRSLCCHDNNDIYACHDFCNQPISSRYNSAPCAETCPNTCLNIDGVFHDSLVNKGTTPSTGLVTRNVAAPTSLYTMDDYNSIIAMDVPMETTAVQTTCKLGTSTIIIQMCEFTPWAPWKCIHPCCHGVGPIVTRSRKLCCKDNTDIPGCHAFCNHTSLSLREETSPCASVCYDTCTYQPPPTQSTSPTTTVPTTLPVNIASATATMSPGGVGNSTPVTPPPIPTTSSTPTPIPTIPTTIPATSPILTPIPTTTSTPTPIPTTTSTSTPIPTTTSTPTAIPTTTSTSTPIPTTTSTPTAIPTTTSTSTPIPTTTSTPTPILTTSPILTPMPTTTSTPTPIPTTTSTPTPIPTTTSTPTPIPTTTSIPTPIPTTTSTPTPIPTTTSIPTPIPTTSPITTPIPTTSPITTMPKPLTAVPLCQPSQNLWSLCYLLTLVSTTPIPSTPISTTPIPSTPISTTQIPSTPISTTQIPSTPISTTQIPSTPISTTQIPSTPISTTQIPSTPISTTQIPSTPISTTHIPSTPVQTTQIPSTPYSTSVSSVVSSTTPHRNASRTGTWNITIDGICYKSEHDVVICGGECSEAADWGQCIHDCNIGYDKFLCRLISISLFILGLVVGATVVAIIACLTYRRNKWKNKKVVSPLPDETQRETITLQDIEDDLEPQW